ncbi:MAG TPA: hypothetical protein VK470_10250 [Bacteroidota bacterium]|nr:hypothetical protein [Bacteroidota bacterium]
MIHRLYILILFIAGLAATLGLLARNYEYYALPTMERPFHPRYEDLKPSGVESHGLGIVGTVMIIGGVVMYSARKRMKMFAHTGKIKNVLEFHIFLCLLGPILVMYHTTFKFGGLVAVSFWCMMAVVASGVVGRFLYVHIPKGIHGNELSIKELEAENQKLLTILESDYHLDPKTIRSIDALALSNKPYNEMSTAEMLWFLFVSDITRRRQLRKIRNYLHRQSVDARLIHKIARIASEHIILNRRIAFLGKIQQLFNYWHIVHRPFSIIMFVILFIHVGVAITFGYTWIL